ncbi:MAG: cation:proton antiporter [Nevskiales bacterium]|nr:cation:proton antiporter [Nevskiales bacterium]
MFDIFAHTAFGEVAILLVIAAAMGVVGIFLRQPLIVSFIAVGLIAGPSALNIVRSGEQIDLLSELGITVLVFLVGIKLDVKLVRSLGSVAVKTGLGQVAFTSLFGYLIGLVLGLGHIESLYVAVALTFSSTIIVVKLLSDKREIDSLHGQIALGFLIVQDLVVVLAMIVLSTIGLGSGDRHEDRSVAFTFLAGMAMVGLVILFVRYAATFLTERLARLPELLVIFAIALASIFAALSDMVGLGKEVGGLLAGIALASTPYRETISARLAPLRDFLLLFFFIALGAGLDLSTLGTHTTAAMVFSLFVLIGNPLIVLAIMGAIGYRKRTGFLAGLTVAQISEFSLIFVAMGVSLGHVDKGALGLVTMVGMVTIAASTYMITYSHRLYAVFEPFLGIFERAGTPLEPGDGEQGRRRYGVLVFGLVRFGTAIGIRMKTRGVRVLGVDFNPLAVRRWHELGLEATFGDATDAEFVAGLPLSGAEWIVSTVPVQPWGPASREDTRITLIQFVRSGGFGGRLAVTSHHLQDTEALVAAGADVVLEPFQDAADRALEIILGGVRQHHTAIPALASERPQVP